MGNSITTFSERLKKAYNDKKKQIKESGGKYSKEEFAKNVYGVGTDGKVHVDRVNKWFQGKNFPSPDLIPEIAKELDCDIAYLFGEIDCKHSKEQQIVKLTGLSEEASNMLLGLKEKNNYRIALEHILLHNEFNTLLDYLIKYGISVYALKRTDISDILRKKNLDRKDSYKYHVATIFSGIIDDIGESLLKPSPKSVSTFWDLNWLRESLSYTDNAFEIRELYSTYGIDIFYEAGIIDELKADLDID